jgi:hypothetical protein
VKSLALAALLSAAPALASAPQPGATKAFAVALGDAAFAITADAASVNGRVVVRRLGLDGGVLWEDRWGSGRGESPIEAAVTLSQTVVVAGDSSQGCFAARWNGAGRQLWATDLLAGEECHARTIVVDANNTAYVLGTTTLKGVYAATVWKIDRHGQIEWTYRDDPSAPDYAFALLLSASGDYLTVTTVRRDGTGWQYSNFALDDRGNLAAIDHY